MHYGICDVVGTGTNDDPYRPLAADYGCDYVAIIPDDNRCAFVKVENGDLAGLDADPGAFRITLALTDVLTAGQATFTNGKLDRWSLTTRASAGQTVKQVLVDIMQELDVTADFKNYRLNNQE